MNWTDLENTSQLDQLERDSQTRKILIYKHSNRCGICDSVKRQLEKGSIDTAAVVPYFLDVIKNRAVSNEVAGRYYIPHESPQVILLSAGKAVYHASHFDINIDDITQQVAPA